jgi:hypothetical protein
VPIPEEEDLDDTDALLAVFAGEDQPAVTVQPAPSRRRVA